MSSDLSVKVIHSIPLNSFVSLMHNSLKQLLSIENLPELIFKNDGDELTVAIEVDTVIGLKGQYILIGIRDMPDAVIMMFYEVEDHPPHVTPEEVGIWGLISVGASKSPAEFAIAAAAAVALSSTQLSVILDNGCVWSSSFEVNVQDLMEKLTVKSKGENFYESAKNMFSMMKI
ncbi:hypothetical protein ACFSR7_05090 [Cohnella sp. GCM10020058]|uniref:hypothetical protein n=1 Tax=Cohnella sp. GCM10020058 TaxID=3317330 RepID=UPI00362CBC61